ncbi:hypothetical protein GJ496_006499 [Pomphorhynchus laevis]|nr:hypothetical protein GJ496_006499 [Pomphorhynchus laevis]
MLSLNRRFGSYLYVAACFKRPKSNTSIQLTNFRNTVEPKKFTDVPANVATHPACIVSPGFRNPPQTIKRRLPSVKDQKNPLEVVYNTFSSLPHWHEYRAYPIEADIIILGGGLVGSAIAYSISKRVPQTKVVVVERDHTYALSDTVNSGFASFRTQFTLDENVALTLASIEILRDELPFQLLRQHIPPVHVPFHHQSHLVLVSDDRIAANHERAVTMQNEMGGTVSLMNQDMIKNEFPWINTDDLLVASYGLENEGWIDPYDLLAILRSRATGHGAHYIQGHVVGFDKEIKHGYNTTMDLSNVLVVDAKQNLRPIQAARIIIAGGSDSASMAARCGVGTDMEFEQLNLPLPIAPFERSMFVIKNVDLPFNCPIIVDPSGIMFTRPEGWPEGYMLAAEPIPLITGPLATVSSSASECDFLKNSAKDLIFKVLRNRLDIPLDDAEVVCQRKSKIDLNYFDGNWILGRHPFLEQLYFACGSSGNAVQHCLAVGRAMSELQFYKSFRTLDMQRLSFDRVVSEQPLIESIII